MQLKTIPPKPLVIIRDVSPTSEDGLVVCSNGLRYGSCYISMAKPLSTTCYGPPMESSEVASPESRTGL